MIRENLIPLRQRCDALSKESRRVAQAAQFGADVLNTLDVLCTPATQDQVAAIRENIEAGAANVQAAFQSAADAFTAAEPIPPDTSGSEG